MARIFCIANQKGGVGKTTTCVNLAAGLATAGQRVLLIDLDPQGNSTHYLLGDAAEKAEDTLAGLFEQSLNFKFNPKKTAEFVHATPYAGLSIMPSHPDLGDLQGKLESRYKIFKLREALDELEDDFDAVFIDTPPALNFYTRSALMGASGCLIPFDCDDFSRQALYTLLANVQEIRADHNPDLQVKGIVVNQFQARASLPRRLVQELIDEGLPVLQPYLPSSVKVRESHQQSLPMVHLEPRHKLTLALLALHEALQ